MITHSNFSTPEAVKNRLETVWRGCDFKLASVLSVGFRPAKRVCGPSQIGALKHRRHSFAKPRFESSHTHT